MACRCNAQGLPLHPRGEPGELVPWITLGGYSSSVKVTQPYDEWMDGAPFGDVVLCVDVVDCAGSAHLYLQTSCVEDDSAFVTVVDHTLSATGQIYYKVASDDTVPLARFLRWKIADASTAWRVTFRVLATFKRQH